jgi:hypothetical protein
MWAGRYPYKELRMNWFVLLKRGFGTLQMTQSGVSCSWIIHMQLMNTNGKVDGIPNGSLGKMC